MGIMLRRIFPLLIIVVSATAQESECVKSCFNKAFALAYSFPCDNGDGRCLCKAPEFYDTIRDCARLNCSPADQAAANANVVAGCADEGVSISVHSTQTINSTSSSAASSATPSTAFTLTSASSTVTPSTTTVGGSPPPRLASSSELSTGAKAGIGIGAGVLAILTVFLAFLIYRRRKAHKQEADEDSSFSQHPELETTANRHEIHSPEMVNELPDSPTKFQPHKHARISELYGDRGYNVNDANERTQSQEQYHSEKEAVPIPTFAHGSGLVTAATRDSTISTEGQSAMGHSKTLSTVSYASDSSALGEGSVSGTGSAAAAAAASNAELKQEMKRIRIERERLNGLQELEERETELVRRMQAGGGGGGGTHH